MLFQKIDSILGQNGPSVERAMHHRHQSNVAVEHGWLQWRLGAEASMALRSSGKTTYKIGVLVSVLTFLMVSEMVENTTHQWRLKRVFATVRHGTKWKRTGQLCSVAGDIVPR